MAGGRSQENRGARAVPQPGEEGSAMGWPLNNADTIAWVLTCMFSFTNAMPLCFQYWMNCVLLKEMTVFVVWDVFGFTDWSKPNIQEVRCWQDALMHLCVFIEFQPAALRQSRSRYRGRACNTSTNYGSFVKHVQARPSASNMYWMYWFCKETLHRLAKTAAEKACSCKRIGKESNLVRAWHVAVF